MKAINLIAGMAMASLGIAPQSKVYGAENIKRTLQRQGRSRQVGSFDPRINRWTGEPHKHEREIARRARQKG